MANGTPIRLLLATSCPQVQEGVRRVLAEAGIEVQVRSFPAAGALLEWLERQQAKAKAAPGTPASSRADVLLFSEDDIPGRSADRLAQACARVFEGPFILLASAARDRSRLHLLRRPAPSVILVEDLQHLAVAVERVLRERELRETEARMRAEILRAADTVSESQKLATVGRLAGSIAHEINNPLESITNLLYLIDREPGLPQQAHRYLALAQSELRRVVEISKQTLNFSRNTVEPTLVTVPGLLEEVLSLYARRIGERSIAVEREYGASTPILAQPGEIRQVLSNLVSNALEAMEPGGKLRLRVRDAHEWWPGRRAGLRISVGDTGSGIARETRRRMGEPFFTTKGQSGTGLGLWVSQTILRRHGGSLRVRSRTGPRHGTVFSIFLPVAARESSAGRTGERAANDNCLPMSRPSGAHHRSYGNALPRRGDGEAEQHAIGY